MKLTGNRIERVIQKSSSKKSQLTMGAAKASIPMHVVADIPVSSLMTPAAMAPAIPPRSNNVAKSALTLAFRDAAKGNGLQV